MKVEVENPFTAHSCFFCGRNNEHGLRLRFYWDAELREMSTDYLPAPHFSGQGSILHGAIQMGLLDEIMGWTSHEVTGEMAVTSDFVVRFLRPTHIRGEKIHVTCRVLAQEGPRITMIAELRSNSGELCTTATGTYHILPKQRFDLLIAG